MISRRNLLLVAGLFLLLNATFAFGLGMAGVLNTWDGSVTTVSEIDTPNGEVVLSSDSSDQFVDDHPSDANAFYNAVILLKNEGTLYPVINPPADWESSIQITYHYAPIVIFIYYLLYILTGTYFQFKLLLLLTSLLSVGIGTYLLLRAEFHHRNISVPHYVVGGLSVLSIGFQPMITNFKTGQSTPFIFFPWGCLVSISAALPISFGDRLVWSCPH